VIISDALRYEVAAELCDTITRTTKGTAKLDAVQAVFPSITKFGMAALIPGESCLSMTAWMFCGRKAHPFYDERGRVPPGEHERVAVQ
jgi:hypothetical protein